MYYYTYEQFFEDTRTLAKEIKRTYEPDVILAIARGGVMLGHFLAELLELRDLYSMNSIHYEKDHKLDTIEIYNIPDLSNKQQLLIVDDVIDSGETMIEIKRVLHKKFPHLTIKVATALYKDNALFIPDYRARHTNEWINFFWDIQLDK